jgi:hypothetical protein
MRRFVAAVCTAGFAFMASVGTAAADVGKLVIKDPGWVNSNVCQAGAQVCGEGDYGSSATIELAIKCTEGETYTLFVLVKQGSENQGTTQTQGECTGSASRRFVQVYPDTGSFSPGGAKVKASAYSDPGGVPASSSGVFEANTDRKITLVEGSPDI